MLINIKNIFVEAKKVESNGYMTHSRNVFGGSSRKTKY